MRCRSWRNFERGFGIGTTIGCRRRSVFQPGYASIRINVNKPIKREPSENQLVSRKTREISCHYTKQKNMHEIILSVRINDHSVELGKVLALTCAYPAAYHALCSLNDSQWWCYNCYCSSRETRCKCSEKMMRDRYFKIERPLLAFVVFTVFFSVRCQTYKHSTRSFLDAEQALTHRTANEAGYLQEGSNNRGKR